MNMQNIQKEGIYKASDFKQQSAVSSSNIFKGL